MKVACARFVEDFINQVHIKDNQYANGSIVTHPVLLAKWFLW